MVSTEMRSTIQARMRKHNVKRTWEEVDAYFQFSKKEKLFCEYCGIEVKDSGNYPYLDIISFDHKIPLSTNQSGTNIENIAICCTRCNIVKGAMHFETYKKFLELLNADLNWKEKILSEMFWGRRANTIQRKNNEQHKEMPKYLHEFLCFLTIFRGKENAD